MDLIQSDENEDRQRIYGLRDPMRDVCASKMLLRTVIWAMAASRWSTAVTEYVEAAYGAAFTAKTGCHVILR